MLAGTGLEWFGLLYRRAALLHGWTPAQVNECEVWELSSAFGVPTEDLEAWQKSRPPGSAGVVHSGRDLVAERVLAAREGREVEAPVMSPESLLVLQEAVSGGR